MKRNVLCQGQALSIFAIWLSLGLFGCTLQKPATENPAPNRHRVAKTFFTKTGEHGEILGRTFLCGWSVESTAGAYSRYVLDHYNSAGHCNLEFEITETALIGKLINPSYPTDRTRWINLVSIPIKQHYYVEPKKDDKGRDLNENIENPSRSDWSARPFMDLDLSGIRILDPAYSIFGFDRTQILSTSDVEWDEAKGFLGFTAQMIGDYYGSRVQADVRYNFLEFHHNPNFKTTPYVERNSKYLNVLQIIGEMEDGAQPIEYAAHWETSQVRDVYLYGFPPEYVHVGQEAVELWNDAFEKTGNHRPFRVQTAPQKHAFDLRHPTITWVADKRMSASGPLGIATSVADVTNGEMLWGQVSLWGGELESYINAYNTVEASAVAEGSNSERPLVQLGLAESEPLLARHHSSVPSPLTRPMDSATLRRELGRMFGQELNTVRGQQLSFMQSGGSVLSAQNPLEILNPLKAFLDSTPGLTPAEVKAKADDFLNFTKARLEARNQQAQQGAPFIEDLVKLYDDNVADFSRMARDQGSSDQIFNSEMLQRLIGQPSLAESLKTLPGHDQAGSQIKSNMSRAETLDYLRGLKTKVGPHAAVHDLERTFDKVAGLWAQGMSQTHASTLQVIPAIVKDLILHEFGHMIGLGHNFKENILPNRGDVPDKYLDGADGLVAKAENGFTNFSTVMGYKDGITDVMTPYADVKPGPHDILSLEYIYNARYPTYAAGEDDFTFVKLLNDGIIREPQQGKRHVAYFPACNDYDASFSEDPYCNRWDRGYDAVTLVQNYLEEYRGNLVSRLFAFSDTVKGGSYWQQEGYLWSHSLTTFGRTRVFYDYMRSKYKDVIKNEITVGGANGEQNLLDFSASCQDDAEAKTSNRHMIELFRRPENAEFKKLCVATGFMIHELQSFLKLPGSDYTLLDPNGRYMSAGETGGEVPFDYSKIFGAWTEISRVPIKISALYALTFPYPTLFDEYGYLEPITRYARPDGNYLINTFYPKEFTETIASTVEHNLTFGNSELEDQTKIGKAVLALGFFLDRNSESNDVLSGIDTPYIENIRNQAKFDYSFAVVEVTRADEKGKEVARKFTGSIFNFFSSRGPETIPEIYLYTKNRTILMPPPRSLIYPVSPIRWVNETMGYYYVLKMDYTDDFYDRLKTNSVKKVLETSYYNIMKACVQGENRNGLRYFFNQSVSPEVFPGFTFRKTIWENPNDQVELYKSIEEQFQRYYSNSLEAKDQFNPPPNPKACSEAIRGQGLLVSTAAALNGFYLQQLYDFIEKGVE